MIISAGVESYRGDIAVDDVVFGHGCDIERNGVLPTALPTAPPTAPPCDPALFSCGDGQCINKTLVCNFLDDCKNGTDEQVGINISIMILIGSLFTNFFYLPNFLPYFLRQRNASFLVRVDFIDRIRFWRWSEFNFLIFLFITYSSMRKDVFHLLPARLTDQIQPMAKLCVFRLLFL